MEQYKVTGMSCAACQTRVEKAVSAVDGVESCAVSLLTNSMGVEGTASPEAIIAAVTAAGYGASRSGDAKAESTSEDSLKDTETPKMKKRLIAAIILSCALLAGCGKNVPIEALPEENVSAVSTTVEEPREAQQEATLEASEAVEASSDATDSDSSEAASSASTKEEKESSASASTTAPAPAEQQPEDYGRIIFVGDSRTVDIFDSEGYEVYDRNVNGVRVFAENGRGCEYMMEIVNRYDGQYETLVTWLGCNDHYNIEMYKSCYEQILAKGINLVLCNVGPTQNENLDEWDSTRYRNEDMVAFNQQITAWASDHGVKVIDMYSYVYANLTIDYDGIHYSPKVTDSIWNHIMGSM